MSVAAVFIAYLLQILLTFAQLMDIITIVNIKIDLTNVGNKHAVSHFGSPLELRKPLPIILIIAKMITACGNFEVIIRMNSTGWRI